MISAIIKMQFSSITRYKSELLLAFLQVILLLFKLYKTSQRHWHDGLSIRTRIRALNKFFYYYYYYYTTSAQSKCGVMRALQRLIFSLMGRRWFTPQVVTTENEKTGKKPEILAKNREKPEMLKSTFFTVKQKKYSVCMLYMPF